jgi:exosortase/archaeosortase family protein
MKNTEKKKIQVQDSKKIIRKKKKQRLNLSDWFKKNRTYLKFAGIFLAVLSVYYLAVLFLNDSFFAWYINITAHLSTIFLNLFGYNTSVIGATIVSPEYAIELSFGCEGTEPVILFIAAVAAFPLSFKIKLPGLLIGSAVLYILNLIRIAALFMIGMFFPESVDSFHTEIFPIFFIFLAIIVWGIWITWGLRKSKKSGKSSEPVS